MYLRPNRTYYASDREQRAGRGDFLILVQDKDNRESGPGSIRALVRKVALHQCGHFMMGSARAFGHRITISGAYGADGLPRDVPAEVYARAVQLPDELCQQWATGDGHNSAGSEAPSLREWALANLDKLGPARPSGKG